MFIRIGAMATMLWGCAGTAAQLPSRTTVVNAAAFPGLDLGARVNAADRSLGACGEIQVTESGTISTPILLSRCRTLRFLVPTTWIVPIRVSSGNKIYGRGPASLVHGGALGSQRAYIDGTAVSDVEIAGISLRASEHPSRAVYLAGFTSSKNIRIRDTQTENSYIVELGSSSGSYRGVNETNLNHQVSVIRNRTLTARNADHGASVMLAYCDGFEVAENDIQGGDHGILWWGGDANPARDGGTENVRWAMHGFVHHNRVRNVLDGGIWGSMGTDVRVASNLIENCGDVCLDVEGSTHTTFSQNIARNGGPGGTAGSFFYNQGVTFSHNILISSNSTSPLFRIWNASQSAEHNIDVLLLDNTMECLDKVRPCKVESDAIKRFFFSSNTLKNTIIDLTGNNMHSVEISNNNLTFDKLMSSPFTAIEVDHVNQLHSTGAAGNAYIHGNHTQSNVEQPLGSVCIGARFNDFNAGDEYRIEDNECSGSKPFRIGISVETDSRHPGIKPRWIIRRNKLTNGTISHIVLHGQDNYTDDTGR